MIKTNLLVNQVSCEQDATIVCEDTGVLFGPKTGNKVIVSLGDGKLIRIDAFNIQASIKINLLDKDPGAACADCGTGFKKPYAPCGDCSPKSLETWNTTEYIRGPGVFEFESMGIPGTPYVKYVELNSTIYYEEFCKKCSPNYCPSIKIQTCETGSTEFGYAFHDADNRDPAATVRVDVCATDPNSDCFWLYPTAGAGHTVKITDCNGAVIGYAANKSDCA